MNTCKKDILDYTKMAHECLPKRHMGLHKSNTWGLVKKTYGTTQKWHLNACEKGIWDHTKVAHECLWETHMDYTKMAHECLLKKHMGLHKIGTWTIVFYYSEEILETMSSILPWEFSAS